MFLENPCSLYCSSHRESPSALTAFDSVCSSHRSSTGSGSLLIAIGWILQHNRLRCCQLSDTETTPPGPAGSQAHSDHPRIADRIRSLFSRADPRSEDNFGWRITDPTLVLTLRPCLSDPNTASSLVTYSVICGQHTFIKALRQTMFHGQ